MEEACGWDNSSVSLEDYDIPYEPLPELPELFDIPFSRWHRFLTFLHSTLWELCADVVRNNGLLQTMTRYASKVECIGKLGPSLGRAWWDMQNTTPDKIGTLELTQMILLMRCWKAPESVFVRSLVDGRRLKAALIGIDQVRHKHVHRESISMDCIANAIMLPAILKDDGKFQDIRREFKLAIDGPDGYWEQPKHEIPIYFHGHQVLAEIQIMLERACFEKVSRDRLDLLKDGEVPEQRELACWRCDLSQTNIEEGEFPESTRWLVDDAFNTLVHLRNNAAHRNDDDPPRFREVIQAAIMILILIGRRTQAIEVEILAEGYCTQKPRKEVLERLRDNFLSLPLFPSTPHERRRECRRRLAIAEVLEKSGTTLTKLERDALLDYTSEEARLESEQNPQRTRFQILYPARSKRHNGLGTRSSPFILGSSREQSPCDLAPASHFENNESACCASQPDSEAPSPLAMNNSFSHSTIEHSPTIFETHLTHLTTLLHNLKQTLPPNLPPTPAQTLILTSLQNRIAQATTLSLSYNSSTQTPPPNRVLNLDGLQEISHGIFRHSHPNDSEELSPDIGLHKGRTEPLTFSASMHECLKGAWGKEEWGLGVGVWLGYI